MEIACPPGYISRERLIEEFALTVPEMRLLCDLITRYPELLPVTEDGLLPIHEGRTAAKIAAAEGRRRRFLERQGMHW